MKRWIGKEMCKHFKIAKTRLQWDPPIAVKWFNLSPRLAVIIWYSTTHTLLQPRAQMNQWIASHYIIGDKFNEFTLFPHMIHQKELVYNPLNYRFPLINPSYWRYVHQLRVDGGTTNLYLKSLGIYGSFIPACSGHWWSKRYEKMNSMVDLWLIYG